jgi:hypothetical protein
VRREENNIQEHGPTRSETPPTGGIVPARRGCSAGETGDASKNGGEERDTVGPRTCKQLSRKRRRPKESQHSITWRYVALGLVAFRPSVHRWSVRLPARLRFSIDSNHMNNVCLS